MCCFLRCFFFSSRRRHTRCGRDWSSDVCSSDLVLGASLVGVGAWGSGQISQALWTPLTETTVGVVRALLGLVYPDVYYDLAEQVVGTAMFQVTIAPACSGYEGVGCVTLLLLLYLWSFRRHLRFPQSLLLLPIGAVAAWGDNALRLAVLIALGT